MAAPKKSTLLKKARYLIPFLKPLSLGLIDPENEIIKDLASAGLDLLGAEAKEKIKDYLAKEPDAATGLLDEHLVRHTGAVLAQLVRHYAKDPAREKQRQDYLELAKVIPGAWAQFLESGAGKMKALRKDAFLDRLATALDPQAAEPALDTAAFVEFFRWTAVEKDVLGPLKPGLTPPLADWIPHHLDTALLTDLCKDTPAASAAFREVVLRHHAKAQGKLDVLQAVLQQHGQRLDELKVAQQSHDEKTQQNHREVQQQLDRIEERQMSAEARYGLAAYRRSLLAAFRPYKELALYNFAAAEQACPDIWDIFVHPACATEHLRPEQMDAAQRETPPRLPAQDLLPLLAQDSHRRTVLLADPGMGKSTLVQSLVAHLASGRTLAGAAALTGLLPVPLILRDLVPLLPQDKVSSWTWDALLTAFLEKYQRDDTSPPLCAAFHEHLHEFRAHLATNPAVFFLIDGLDEIGDLPKRRQIVRCIQDGIRAVSKEARWLVTSRVIGYDQAEVDFAEWEPEEIQTLKELVDREKSIALSHIESLWFRYAKRWRDFAIADWIPKEILELFPSFERDEEGGKFHLHSANTPRLLQGLDRLPIAQRLYLAPFDDRRQDQFTQRWFQHQHNADYSRQLMAEVRRHHHDGVRIIARVPNLLCLMNILKCNGKPLPDGRAALYDKIVEAYLGGIDATYRLRPILGSTCPFDAAQRRFLLALLGAHMQQTRVAGDSAASAAGRAAGPPAAARGQGAHEAPETISKPPAPRAALGGPSALPGDSAAPEADGNLLISRAEISALLLPVIEPMLQGRADLAARPAAEWLDELLHHIASRAGLLIPRSTDAGGQVLFGFTHLSFLEYFAAEWLGREFDRRQRQLARQTEAMQDGEALTPADLEQLFPPEGPVIHDRPGFAALPAQPAWHEPLIFLLESRPADSATLLRWLFPALHSGKPHLVSEDDRNARPLLPLEAVRLVVKLALDTEVALPEETRCRWWQRLWGAYLDWPHPPFTHPQHRRWPIAPVLLERQERRAEVLQALSAEQPRHPGKPLYLCDCAHLISADLQHLSGLESLRVLDLTRCTGLRDTAALGGLSQLQWLNLSDCTGIKGAEAWQGLAQLESLRELFLSGCTGLEDTAALRRMCDLIWLDLADCKALDGVRAWLGVAELVSLRVLVLSSCTGLRDTSMLAELHQLEAINLSFCTGLEDAAAWQGLAGRHKLWQLNLMGCNGLRDTAALAGLRQLEMLDLAFCTGLESVGAIQGLAGLEKLRELDLTGCTGLDAEAVREVWKMVPAECRIIGPDGEDVEP